MNAWFDFAVAIDRSTCEEKGWLATQFLQIPPNTPIDDGESDEDPKPTYGPVTALEYGMRKEGVTSHDIGFGIYKQRDGSEHILLSNTGDGSGETGVLHHLLQSFTAAFPERPPIEVEWACNADRHAPGIYGGGATLFHQGEAYYFDTTRFLAIAQERIERRQRRFDELPAAPDRYYLRYVSFAPETLESLTTECDGTVGEAIENAAEAIARSRLEQLTGHDTKDWIAYYCF